MPESEANVDLAELVGLFYSSPDELGEFTPVVAEEMPAAYQRLLAHAHHMTVTVEEFHRSLVDVNVHQVHHAGDTYARRISLTRQSDGRPVQFGIVRLDLRVLEPEVRTKIERQVAPLGRILIEHNVLREIELGKLWRVIAGNDLGRLLDITPGTPTYGRTAMIHCNGAEAVELLEIVSPVE